MSDSPRTFPAGLKWVCRIAGMLVIAAALYVLALTGIAVWKLMHSQNGILAQPGTLLAKELGQIVGAGVGLWLGIWLFRLPGKRGKKHVSPTDTVSSPTEPVAQIQTEIKKSPVRSSKKRVYVCNVLDATSDARRVWQFDAGKFLLKGEQTRYLGEPLPEKLVAKDWLSLFQPKLNIAWLPPENVFLRVIHLPKASLDETVSMVDLQLEKLSPVPVTQIVWTLHILPHATEGMQTVLVVIAARNVVEEFLGKLEGQGYIADRLEIPFLEQLLATNVSGDGAWIFPEARGAKNSAVVAWSHGGILRSVDLILLPEDGLNSENLRDQLRQMTWAGELEGWLTGPPAWHLVASETAAVEWEKMLREAVDTPVTLVAPLSSQEIAALTARRAASNTTTVGLLPSEYAARYRQQFVDRLWMKGIFAAGLVYVVGVLIYLAAVQVLAFRTNRVERQLADISGTYTNALELKARYAVLKDRQELKYAALDCWKAVADLLPASVTLESLNFNDGQKLVLNGSLPSDAQKDIIDFSEALRKTTVNDQPLFNTLSSDPLPTVRPNGWSYNLELKRSEALP